MHNCMSSIWTQRNDVTGAYPSEPESHWVWFQDQKGRHFNRMNNANHLCHWKAHPSRSEAWESCRQVCKSANISLVTVHCFYNPGAGLGWSGSHGWVSWLSSFLSPVSLPPPSDLEEMVTQQGWSFIQLLKRQNHVRGGKICATDHVQQNRPDWKT